MIALMASARGHVCATLWWYITSFPPSATLILMNVSSGSAARQWTV